MVIQLRLGGKRGAERDSKLVGQKKLGDKCEDPDVLQNISKANMTGMMEVMKEYLRLCSGVDRAPLAYIIIKDIVVKTYGTYLSYATPGNKMVAMM